MTCRHARLDFGLSTHAETIEYRRPTPQQRVSATNSAISRKKLTREDESVSKSTFPAPIVLPNDALSLDPRCPPQSFRSWLRLKDRNEVTSERSVIYVAAPPGIDSEVQFMESWSHPQKREKPGGVPVPSVQDLLDYLLAFFDGLPVRLVPPPKLRFAKWDADAAAKRSRSSKSTLPLYVGLNTQTECVRIRTRPSYDKAFAAQLNLDDLLDAAISMLPEDAYALLLLVNHDLYEDDDDDFVCGRAYGGSRVAVISTARYNPILDQGQGVEREHAWPASHCEAYIRASCEVLDDFSNRPKKKLKASKKDPLPTFAPPDDLVSPMLRALAAHRELPALHMTSSPSALSALWLGRVCRTASHELGHCFGMEHCVYYACVMQSSSSLAEDARQPPFLCPVDLAKLLHSSKGTAEARYQALLRFCDRHSDVHLFAAFAAWIRALIESK